MGSIATVGRLPCGGFTRSNRKYIDEWRCFCACIVKGLEAGGVTGFYVGAFDPGVALFGRTSVQSFSIDEPVSTALARIGGWKKEADRG